MWKQLYGVCVCAHLRVFVPLHHILPAAVSEEQVRREGVREPLAHCHQQLWKTQRAVLQALHCSRNYVLHRTLCKLDVSSPAFLSASSWPFSFPSVPSSLSSLPWRISLSCSGAMLCLNTHLETLSAMPPSDADVERKQSNVERGQRLM